MASLKAAYIGDPYQIARVYSLTARAAISERVSVLEGVVSASNVNARLPELAEVDILLSTWGMPLLEDRIFDQLPNLKLVLYAAGDTRGFAEPLVKRRIPVVSAWRANAIPVAEFTLAQILMAGKQYSQNVRSYRRERDVSLSSRGFGNVGQTVSILGAGAVGTALIELLEPFAWKILVFDPFLSKSQAAELGVEQVNLIDAFLRGNVVSNHLANNEGTRQLITKELLARMPKGATFINTGRGATVDQTGLSEVMQMRPDLSAVLDVTVPEPLLADSPLWALENVFLSTHIAGSEENELTRMADLCVDELKRFLAGEPLLHQVRPQDLEL